METLESNVQENQFQKISIESMLINDDESLFSNKSEEYPSNFRSFMETFLILVLFVVVHAVFPLLMIHCFFMGLWVLGVMLLSLILVAVIPCIYLCTKKICFKQMDKKQ